MSVQPNPMTTEEYQLLNELISEHYGVYFPERKMPILESRLRPRLQQLHLGRYMDYYLLLQYDAEGELEHLTHLVTNNETYFFRETQQFEALFEEAFDELRATAEDAARLKLLCAGCSSGEEPYTLEIYAREYPVRTVGLSLEIDGFDIDTDRLEIARKAHYGPNSLRIASEEQIRSHFVRTGTDRFALNPRYQGRVRFHHGNILDRLTWPSMASYDVIFCRNVLIYFSEVAIHRAVDNFAGSLRPGGILFLGHAESIIGLSDELETIKLNRCIAYRRV